MLFSLKQKFYRIMLYNLSSQTLQSLNSVHQKLFVLQPLKNMFQMLGLSNIVLGVYLPTWMGDRMGMPISADSPSDETLNRGPLVLLLRRQYEFTLELI